MARTIALAQAECMKSGAQRFQYKICVSLSALYLVLLSGHTCAPVKALSVGIYPTE